jgi:multiple sugar transport system permease protein
MSKKLRHGFRMTDSMVGFVLVLPALAIFCGVILYPFVNSVLMSFTDKSLVMPTSQFVGVENYIKTFKDPTFVRTLTNTAVFVICSTALPFLLGLIWSIILDLKFKGAGIMRGATLINWIIPGASISFLWSFIFDANHGIVNELLTGAGLIDSNINWLGSGKTAMMAVIIARTWQMLPWYMAFLTGGLQGVSYDQIEAARMDGAGNLKVFRHVILPEMKPIIVIVLVLGIIGNLQHFDIPQVMTSGGPAGSTTLLSTAVYRQAFSSYKVGMAATIGTIWAIFLAMFSIFYSRNAGRD